MDIQIIVDSCCDLTPALRNLLRVSVASLKIDVGSIHYVDDEHIDTKKLIADMKAYKNAPSTACPSPDEYAALMEKSEESFVVTLSGKLSGSYNAACVGREMVLERSPEKKIHIFDSESASAGETLIALMLRDRIDGVIDCSPFGCRTGFHLIMWGTPSVREVTAAIASSLHAIAEEVTWEDVPGTDVYSCGNYRDHSLFSAREWSRTILEQGLSVDPFERVFIVH